MASVMGGVDSRNVSRSATASRLAARPGYPGSVDGPGPAYSLRSNDCEVNARPSVETRLPLQMVTPPEVRYWTRRGLLGARP